MIRFIFILKAVKDMLTKKNPSSKIYYYLVMSKQKIVIQLELYWLFFKNQNQENKIVNLEKFKMIKRKRNPKKKV